MTTKGGNTMSKRTRFWIVCLVVLIVAALAHGVYDKATGAEAKGICRVNTDPDLGCWTPKHAAAEFQAGYYTRSHGVPFHKVYNHPRRAQHAWLTVITVWVKHHPKKARAWEAAHPDSGKHMGSPGSWWACPPEFTGMACDLYRQAMFKSTCVSQAPDPTNAPDVCYIFDRLHDPISAKDIYRGGGFFICGSLVVAGMAASPETGGGSSFIAYAGAGACGWSLWGSFL